MRETSPGAVRMIHFDLEFLMAFLKAVLAGSKPSPSPRPIIGHLVECKQCLGKVHDRVRGLGTKLRLPLYPDPGCLLDSELAQFESRSKSERIGHVKSCLWCVL